MSSQYESLRPDHLYRDIFDVDAPEGSGVGPQVWPRRPGVFIRNLPAPPSVDGAEHTPPGAVGADRLQPSGTSPASRRSEARIADVPW